MNILKDYRILKSLSYQKTASDVMTPLDLAIEIIQSVPAELFGTRLLVPGSGYGTIAMAAVHCGWDPAMITCVELSPVYALVSSKYVGRHGVKVIHHDFLTWNPEMQFDVVIANPPYSLPKGQKKISDGKKNLALQFVEKSVSLLKPNGYVTMLTPPNFLKPTDSKKVTRSFSSLEGIQLQEIETGIESKWFPQVACKIIRWSGIKSDLEQDLKLNGELWDLTQTPFIVDLDSKETAVFRKIWNAMITGSNPVSTRRVGDGDKVADEGWSLTERLNRRKGDGVLKWSKEPVLEKYEQIWISLSPEKAGELFCQPFVRFFIKATDIEPTVYHNLLNGLDFSPVSLTKAETETINSYLASK